MEQDRERSRMQLPIAYTSRLLKAAEKNCTTTDREKLAIIWAMKHFKLCIMGMYFKIVTDHNVLKALQSKNELEKKLLRWTKYLIGFNFENNITQRKMNIVADILSKSSYIATEEDHAD